MGKNSGGTFPLAKILDNEYAQLLDGFNLIKTVVFKKKRYGIYMSILIPTLTMIR